MTLSIPGYGTVVVELFPDSAPKAVAAVAALAEKGFYDGALCLRPAIDLGMEKFYDPVIRLRETLSQGEDPLVPFERNRMSHVRGVVALEAHMKYGTWRRPEYDGWCRCTFFIITGEYYREAGPSTCIGRVRTGMDVIDSAAWALAHPYERKRSVILERVSLSMRRPSE